MESKEAAEQIHNVVHKHVKSQLQTIVEDPVAWQ